jgi:hypothetical protein
LILRQHIIDDKLDQARQWCKKKPRPDRDGVLSDPDRLSAASFRRLERIDFGRFLGSRDHMRRHVAVSIFPFYGWIRTGCAIHLARKFNDPFASVALVHNFMTNPAVIAAPGSFHKRAFDTRSNRCTKHLSHPPF